MLKTWPIKHPNSNLDYGFDWSAWLKTGETIVDAEVSAAGVTISQAAQHDGALVVVWLSGGERATRAYVACTITTSEGRIETEEVVLPINDRW